MKFYQAMKSLEEGKKVRCKSWSEGIFLYDGQSSLYHTPLCYMSEVHKEWELYEEHQTTYTFAEVVKGLREGKKFVRSGQASDLALFVMGHEIYPRSKYGIQTLKMEDF